MPATAPSLLNSKKLIGSVLRCKGKFDAALDVTNVDEVVKTLKKEFARRSPHLSAYPATVRITPLGQQRGVESSVLVHKHFKQILQICAHSSDMLLIQRRRYARKPTMTRTCIACYELWKAQNSLSTAPPSLRPGSPASRARGRVSPTRKATNEDSSEMECDIDQASFGTSAAERIISKLPTLSSERIKAKGRQPKVPLPTEQELRHRLELMQPTARSSKFLDEVGKLIGEAVKDAWEEVRHNGSAAEIVSFGIEAFDLADRYKLISLSK